MWHARITLCRPRDPVRQGPRAVARGQLGPPRRRPGRGIRSGWRSCCPAMYPSTVR